MQKPGESPKDSGNKDSSKTRTAMPSGPRSDWVIGQEYEIHYSNGRLVMAEWDGRFFKVKPGPWQLRQHQLKEHQVGMIIGFYHL